MDGQNLTAAALVLVALGVVGGGVAWALRDRWDLVAEHSRDATRHLLAALLMAGTMAGTVWTFSAGKLTIAGIWEMVVSVGGVAGALECGVIFTGMRLGELDQRIATTRRAELRAELIAMRRTLNRWFYVIASISAVANCIYRTQLTGNFLLAAFISAATIALVLLFAVKLRPLPQDYGEIGRQATQRGLVLLARQSQAILMRSLRRIGRGIALSDAEQAQLAMAVSFMRVYTSGEQQQTLDQVIARQAQTPGLLNAPGAALAQVGDGEWLTTADLQRLYGISERTAQVWMSQTPGRRQRAHSRSQEAPAATIYAAHGVPASAVPAQTGSGSARRRKRTEAPGAAAETQDAAEQTPPGVVDATISAEDLQFAVLETPQGAGQPQGMEV